MIDQNHFGGTSAVREGYEVDLCALQQFVEAEVRGFQGPLTVEQFNGGQSNPTYKLVTPARTYVMRRKPSGPLLKGAHAIEREARVLSALHGTGFPVPEMLALCSDERIIGTPFYVMSMVEGRNFWDTRFPDVERRARSAYFDTMNATLARLHKLDAGAIGLADFGRPDRFCERQIALWSKQYIADAEAGRDPHMDKLIEWLPSHVPATAQTTLVHGDFRCDNLIFHPNQPQIAAVLDWELSTLGDPLADFAHHAMMYRMPPDIVAGLVGADLGELGIPSESDYIASYCERTGRRQIADMPFYLAFAFFRLAAIMHGIKGRLIRGTASSAHATHRARSYPTLAKIAWQQIG